MKPTAEERIHELNKALLFIKENHNGEIPYQFSSNEYGLWMARYANNAVEEYKESFNINKRAEMRKQAIAVIELTKGFTGEPTDNAMKTALEMAYYVMQLTNDLNTKTNEEA